MHIEVIPISELFERALSHRCVGRVPQNAHQIPLEERMTKLEGVFFE